MSREEILAGPLELWLAPRGEPFPNLGEAPAGNWELIGQSGTRNYTADGVSVTLGQTLSPFTPAGSTMKRKVFRTEEMVAVHVTVADVRAETLAVALNGNAPTETTGQREVALLRGPDVTEYALLARGKSPYEEPGNGQVQIPAVYLESSPQVVYQKGNPAGVEFNFDALDPDPAELADFAVIYSDASVV